MHNLVRVFVSGLVVSCLGFAAGAQEIGPAPGGPTMLSSSFSPDSLAQRRIDEFGLALDQAAAGEDFVGLAVAVVRKGDVAMLKTYGVRVAGGAAPVTPDTAFRVGSLSKGFASTLAGLAAANGDLSLDAPVGAYAPAFALKNGAQSKVTVEHILSHQVGLPPNAYDNLLEAGVGLDKILPRFRSVNPICSVGRCYAYQNITYNLIADVLAKTYDQPYENLVRERIFYPLGMRVASFGSAGLQATGNWAAPHTRELIEEEHDLYGPWQAVEIKDAYYRTPAAGGVNASIRDMARWLQAQMGAAPDVLPTDVLNLIHRPVTETPSETRRWPMLAKRLNATRYGLGWRIYDYAGHSVVNHSGTVEGYVAQIAMLPERDIGIVILANAESEKVWRILPTLLDIELGLSDEDWLDLHDDEAPIGLPVTGGGGD